MCTRNLWIIFEFSVKMDFQDGASLSPSLLHGLHVAPPHQSGPQEDDRACFGPGHQSLAHMEGRKLN